MTSSLLTVLPNRWGYLVWCQTWHIVVQRLYLLEQGLQLTSDTRQA